ncbi:possible early light inducible protein [Ostreococcus lucimarinus CCE9901]|jgi:hypothetical protein|uniref:Possible early light inducible protein n=1 Tax=Ostreococcus lucimarinus (strain CCE9901) TaxID=436017 RepID=A4S599_OSTLU|nr:possible early light inducible protein [Ostreococcus lucimarinus CCE9901]ABO98863.1 possible early light inducible protein [Ostreococcus lucimarinus CCE9901]|eukprot:XP_001420570.1 possible early light inducible protein [Ostreococcus lucimarinus CCE9901]
MSTTTRALGTRSATLATTRGRAARRRGGAVRAEGGDASAWKPMAVTKPNLVNNLDGKTTRNIDGKVYTIEARGDEVAVTDKFGASFETRVNKAGVIEADMSKKTGASAGDDVDFASLQITDFVGFNAKYKIPEVVNGRAAMVGAVLALLSKIGGGGSVAHQMFTAGGFSSMLFIMAAVTAATIAPAATGATSLRGAIPDENATFPDERLPTTWTATAEGVNGKVAMVILTLALITGN